MLDYKIFKAGRGEGKTKWLCEQLLGEMEKGELDTDFIYIGPRASYLAFKDSFMRTYNIPCPIRPYDEQRIHRKEVFFTDELTHDMLFFNSYCLPKDGVWYITIESSCFV